MAVEDDEFARTLVGRVLDPLAWDTIFALEGATALAELRRHRLDVILMAILAWALLSSPGRPTNRTIERRAHSKRRRIQALEGELPQVALAIDR